MSKVKIISVFLGSLFLIAALAIGLTLVSKKQNITEKAAPATTLTISPSNQNVYVGQDFSLSVQMNTGSNAVSGMDLNLNFDPNNIQVNSIATGSAILNLTRIPRNPPIDNVSGKIYYSVFSTSTSVTGSNLDVLDIEGTVKPGAALGNKTVGFDNTTAVIALGESGSVLQTKTPGSFVVLAIVTPVVTLNANPLTIVSGGSSTLTWSTTGTAPTCTKSNGWTGSVAVSGNQTVTPTTTKTYALTCTNGAGSDTKSVTVTVTPAPINGGWSAWSPVSCPTACGLTASTQTRTCTNPTPAFGGTSCMGSSTQSCSATAACVCPDPLTDTQTLACPAQYSGSITQTRTKGAYPSCTWGSWITTLNTCIKNGDVNGDGVVNVLDIGEIINNYGTTGSPGWIRSDLNKDGIINILDIGIVINNYGN